MEVRANGRDGTGLLKFALLKFGLLNGGTCTDTSVQQTNLIDIMLIEEIGAAINQSPLWANRPQSISLSEAHPSARRGRHLVPHPLQRHFHHPLRIRAPR